MKLDEVNPNPHDHPLVYMLTSKLMQDGQQVFFQDTAHHASPGHLEIFYVQDHEYSIRVRSVGYQVLRYSKHEVENYMDLEKVPAGWLLRYTENEAH